MLFFVLAPAPSSSFANIDGVHSSLNVHRLRPRILQLAASYSSDRPLCESRTFTGKDLIIISTIIERLNFEARLPDNLCVLLTHLLLDHRS